MKGYVLFVGGLLLLTSCHWKSGDKINVSEPKESGKTNAAQALVGSTGVGANEAQDPKINTHADTKPLIEDFIPEGWKTILHESGDLNKDGIDDHVIVIEDTDSKNLIMNDKLGQDTLNINPRNLLVFFKEKKGGYTLIAKNDISFVPPENNAESTCLADPLLTEGGMGIQKGLLTIHYQYWLSCGSWYVNNASYTFRYQNSKMELIGFDHSEFHRASGEESSLSINFSTRKVSHTTGGNLFDDNESKPTTAWSKWKGNKDYSLDNCNEQTYFELYDVGD
jgi:hypothetical protein